MTQAPLAQSFPAPFANIAVATGWHGRCEREVARHTAWHLAKAHCQRPARLWPRQLVALLQHTPQRQGLRRIQRGISKFIEAKGMLLSGKKDQQARVCLEQEPLLPGWRTFRGRRG
eukprot:CAMPEP_0181403468 /NCGR_PEP_ID=MMETSP1110-20121109/3725_1 /TAXON_ID=174948 /ORGANISM="Symbiodinium sp., Strain CCMP421" /LENGTH=115 /DNA_ID=CAMNT_0023525757 /DNA_START=1474 /DNA_END=1821 /DNA_ORIENTATION=-